MNNNLHQIYSRALKRWGEGSQIMMLFEEFGELMQAISKNQRGNPNRPEIVEEIADCIIMLEQMQIVYNIETETELAKTRKIARLSNLLDTFDYRDKFRANKGGSEKGV